MSIDPRNDRICYYERIMNAFLNADGYCDIRGAAEKIVAMEEKTVKASSHASQSLNKAALDTIPSTKREIGTQKERDETIAMLRHVCEEHGDNDWPDNLHLADVIEKHLWRNLDSTRRESIALPTAEALDILEASCTYSGDEGDQYYYKFTEDALAGFLQQFEIRRKSC